MITPKLPVVLLSYIASNDEDSVNCRIANHILDHLTELKETTISELAKQCYVSVSSISRFCREIGFDDFSELKELIETNKNTFTAQDYPADKQERAETLLNRTLASLQNVVDSVDLSQIEMIARDILMYEDVVIVGMLKAETVALNLQNDLLALGKRTQSKMSFQKQMEYFKHPEVKRLIIVFSFTGVYFDYDFPIDFFNQKRHTKIVFVTSDMNAIQRGLYDLVVTFKSKQDYASHPSQLQFIANLIALAYAQQLQDKR